MLFLIWGQYGYGGGGAVPRGLAKFQHRMYMQNVYIECLQLYLFVFDLIFLSLLVFYSNTVFARMAIVHVMNK